jgi:cyclin-dependent kinase
MGTPSDETWPGVAKLPDYKPTFPQWSKKDLARVIPALDDAGIDILQACIDAVRRFSQLIPLPLEHLGLRFREAHFR